MATVYRVSGMTCQGCSRSVERAIKAVAPEAAISVDLAAGQVRVDGEVDPAAIARAVEEAGFDFAGAI